MIGILFPIILLTMQSDPNRLFRLDERIIILTGGSGLIGMEAVRQLPKLGAQVVIGVRNSDRFQEQIRSIRLPKKCFPPVCLSLDISNYSSVQSFFRKVVERFGKIDVLINNAWPKTEDWPVRFEETEPASLYKNLCDHSGGYFLCCQEASIPMKKQKKGVLLNIGSIYGEVGPYFSIYGNTDMTPAPAEYALIKGGIHTLTKYLATYLAPYNIRVNCIGAGGVYNQKLQDPEFVENYVKHTPLGRMAEPADLIGPIVFLISDASRYVTGTVLMVDGGWTSW